MNLLCGGVACSCTITTWTFDKLTSILHKASFGYKNQVNIWFLSFHRVLKCGVEHYFLKVLYNIVTNTSTLGFPLIATNFSLTQWPKVFNLTRANLNLNCDSLLPIQQLKVQMDLIKFQAQHNIFAIKFNHLHL